MTIRMIELFAGIGATHEAMTELGLDVEIVGISEIDKHAIKGYEAIHGKVNVLGDITKIDHLPECDLITYSWPCQSVSIAGMKAGMVEGSGTESSLLWEVGRLLKDMRERDVLPEYLVAENVDAVLNKLNIGEFRRWIVMLSELGYTSSYRIMNAKDYGTPQNRRRMFMVSTLTHGSFVFPKPCPDGRILRDVLEEDVDDSYFLSEKRIATFEKHRKRNEANGNKFGWRVHVLTDEARERERGDVSQTVNTKPDRYNQTFIAIPRRDRMSHIEYPCDTKLGYMIAEEGDGLVLERPHKARGTVQKNIAPTLTTGIGGGLVL